MKRSDEMHSTQPCNRRMSTATRRRTRKIPALLLLLIFGVALALQAHAVQYSKLGIVLAAKQAGKWETVKAWIAQAGLVDEWQAASYFSDDYPQFNEITNQVVASGLATHEEVDAFLAAARDTAPDALLPAKYVRDMSNDAGRRQWHGDRLAQYIITNGTQLVRVDLYADGYAYTNAATRIPPPRDPEAAERARREAQRKAEEAIAAWERANLPPELAALREAQRQAAKTNEVTVVVGPAAEVR